MPTRRSQTRWTGDLESGSGTVELTSSGLATFDVSFPKRASEDGGGATNPEELIAAAHSACFSMQLSALIAEAGGTPKSLETSSDVTLGPDPAGGFRISKIALRVQGSASNIDEATFRAKAEDAKANCPVSKALTGVAEMTLEVTFTAA